MTKRRLVAILIPSFVALAASGGLALWKYHELPQFCATCHIMQPYLESWTGSDLLASGHAEAGVTCLECHQPALQQQMQELVVYVQGDFQVPLEERQFETQFCFDCHEPNEHTSYEQVSQATAGLELNPHDSHIGEMDCGICHKVHKPSEDYCADCHGPVATGPGWTTEVSTTALLEWATDMDCSSCHVMETYFESPQDTNLLGYAHSEEGLLCLDCHEVEVAQQIHEEATAGQPVTERTGEMEYCFDCHLPNEHTSYEQIIQATAGLELNPHDSHFGEMDCGTCHKVHKPSEDYCAQCHDPVATGPGWTTEVTPTTEVQVWAPDMDCAACHVMDPYFESLEDPNLMAYAHAQEGLACLDCHEVEAVAQVHDEAVAGAPIRRRTVEMEYCFDCHLPNEHTSYEQVIERTQEYMIDNQEINPHDPHEGLEEAEIECRYCHDMHTESPLIRGCYTCHHSGTLESCSTCH